MKRPAQIERVLVMLKAAGPNGVCGLSLYQGDALGPLPNGRTRVGELVVAGHHVDHAPLAACTAHQAHHASYVVYVYRHGPEGRAACIRGGGACGHSRQTQLAI